MSKKFTGNPIAGLQGIPPTIIVDRKSITIKMGLFRSSRIIPFNNIERIDYQGLGSLLGEITIVPYRGEDITLRGFSRTQFKAIQSAINNGGVDDFDDDDD